jgi:hypothetical protein
MDATSIIILCLAVGTGAVFQRLSSFAALLDRLSRLEG